MMTTYVGIDAGKATGVAILHGKDDAPVLYEVDTIDEVVAEVRAMMQQGSPMVVAYEKFTISQRTIETAVDYTTLLFNGWFYHESKRLPYVESRGYTPAQSKGFSTDDKLKHLGWYAPTKGGHQNDAARLLLLTLAKDGDPRVVTPLKGMLT